MQLVQIMSHDVHYKLFTAGAIFLIFKQYYHLKQRRLGAIFSQLQAILPRMTVPKWHYISGNNSTEKSTLTFYVI